jgi:hypothetical protein
VTKRTVAHSNTEAARVGTLQFGFAFGLGYRHSHDLLAGIGSGIAP